MKIFYVAVKFAISDYKAPTLLAGVFEMMMMLMVLGFFFYIYSAGFRIVSEASLDSKDIAIVGIFSSIMFAVIEGAQVRLSRKYSRLNSD